MFIYDEDSLLVGLRLVGQHNDVTWKAVLTAFLGIAGGVYSNNNSNNNKAIIKFHFTLLWKSGEYIHRGSIAITELKNIMQDL